MRIVILFVLLIIAGISLIVIPVDSACGSIPPGSTTIMTKLGIYILKLPAGYQTSDPGQYQTSDSSQSLDPFGSTSYSPSSYSLSLSGQQTLENVDQFLTTTSTLTPTGTSLFDMGTTDPIGLSSSLGDFFQTHTPTVNTTNITNITNTTLKPTITLKRTVSPTPKITINTTHKVIVNSTQKIIANLTLIKNATVTIKKNVTEVLTTIKPTITIAA